MIFKEFVDWCNDRACDGRWSLGAAVACCDILHEVNSQSFWNWKRESYWKEKYEEQVVEQIVNPINQRIEEEDKVHGSGK